MKNMTIGWRSFALVGFRALVIAGISTLAVLRIREQGVAHATNGNGHDQFFRNS